jgi:MFS transporter, DHA3 family, tetracycline resistance protein
MTVLRIRDVRLLVGAVGLSAFGDFMLWIPLALHVEAMTGSPLAVSAFFLVLFGPVVALAGVAGRLADRFENARLLWIASLVQAAAVVLMALTADSLAAILVLTAALGAGNAVGCRRPVPVGLCHSSSAIRLAATAAPSVSTRL